MKRSFICLFGCLALAFLAGCEALKPPKYVQYRSEMGDWVCNVPWGWNVYLDKDGSNFYNYTFVGPFDADFYHGVPSLSVRWYTRNRVHRLRDGGYEIYSSADEYIHKTLTEIYGPQRELEDGKIKNLKVSGWFGKRFTVTAPVDVPPTTEFGAVREKGGTRTVILRKHAYVVLPMDNGFYVLVYPATVHGFKSYEPKFVKMIKSFYVRTDGPGGERI